MTSCSHCTHELPPENDFVTCDGCKNRYHYVCANVRESTWRKYSTDSRLSWRCGICRVKNVVDNSKSAANGESSLTPGGNELPMSSNDKTHRTHDFDEVHYLRELLTHKDLIINNQKDLIESLKDQVKMLKNSALLDLPRENPPVVKGKQRTELPASGVAKSSKLSSKQGSTGKDGISDVVAARKTNNVITQYDVHKALTEAKMQDIIQLANSPGDNDGWQKVKTRGSKRILVGAKIDDGRCKLRAAESLSHWHVYRLHPTTSAEDVKSYLGKDFPGVAVEQLKVANPEMYSSFKVTVPEKDEPRILDVNLWPSGTRINRFFLARSRRFQSGPST